MRTLCFVRHAKSSWEENIPDHTRPLNARGVKDLSLMSAHIAANFPMPDAIYSSTANRALTTALAFKEAYKLPDDQFFIFPELYDFSGKEVLKTIQKAPDSIKYLMVFGHNHAFTDLVNKIGDTYLNNLPTCGFVAIELPTHSWEEVNHGKTTAMVFPRDLKK